MPKLCKRTAEQEEYLARFRQTFIQAHKDNRIERFKNELYEGWFKLWPEQIEVFGKDWKEGDPMTFDDKCVLGKAIDKRMEQLYNHIRWSASGKVVRSQSSGMLKKFMTNLKEKKPYTKRPRKNQKLELYSQKYYEMRFKDQVEQEVLDTTPPNESKKDCQKRRMAIYRKWRSLSWQMESDEIKAEINTLYEENNIDNNVGDSDQDAEGEPDPEVTEHSGEYKGPQCVKKLGELLTSILRELHDETGWAYTILGGGLNHEGEIKIVTSHVGETTAGNMFPQVCNKYQENILQEFLTFINIRHPIEERLLRAQVNKEHNSGTSSHTMETSQASADDKPKESETNQEFSEAAAVVRTSEKTSGDLTNKDKHNGKDKRDGKDGDVISDLNTTSGAALASSPSPGSMVESRFNPTPPPLQTNALSNPVGFSAQDTLADLSMLSHSNAMPASFQSGDFQSTFLPFSPTNSTSAVASAPSFGYSMSTASSPVFFPDADWTSCISASLATPTMQQGGSLYEDLSPMSKFMAMTSPNHNTYNFSTTSANSSLIFTDTTNIPSTTMTSTPTNAALVNPVSTNDVNLQLPTQASIQPNPCEPDSHPFHSLNSALADSFSGSLIPPSAEPENRATETNLLAKSRKRSRKDEVDMSFVLPEGATRAHKPRRLGDETLWEGLASKRLKKV